MLVARRHLLAANEDWSHLSADVTSYDFGTLNRDYIPNPRGKNYKYMEIDSEDGGQQEDGPEGTMNDVEHHGQALNEIGSANSMIDAPTAIDTLDSTNVVSFWDTTFGTGSNGANTMESEGPGIAWGPTAWPALLTFVGEEATNFDNPNPNQLGAVYSYVGFQSQGDTQLRHLGADHDMVFTVDHI